MKSNNRENLETAFLTAEKHLGIPRLLDPEGKTKYKLLYIVDQQSQGLAFFYKS